MQPRRPITCSDSGRCPDVGASVLPLASFLSGGGTPLADVVAIAIAIVTFAFLFWAIDLIDRI
jgi:hypothetical protein